MKLTDAQIAMIQGAARFASRNDLPIEKCPYDANGDPSQKARALIWIRAYRDEEGPTPGLINYEG